MKETDWKVTILIINQGLRVILREGIYTHIKNVVVDH